MPRLIWKFPFLPSLEKISDSSELFLFINELIKKKNDWSNEKVIILLLTGLLIKKKIPSNCLLPRRTTCNNESKFRWFSFFRCNLWHDHHFITIRDYYYYYFDCLTYDQFPFYNNNDNKYRFFWWKTNVCSNKLFKSWTL